MLTGQTKTGEAKTGEGVLTQTIAAPVTTLTLSTPTPTVDPAGAVDVTAPVTTLTFTTLDPTVDPTGAATIGGAWINDKTGQSKTGESPTGGFHNDGVGASLTLTTPDPTVGGSGTASASVPATTLTLTTPDPLIGTDQWEIDGTVVSEYTDEVRTWQTLELTFRVDDATLTSDLHPLRDTAEKLTVVPDSGGGYRALDRAPTDGVYTLTPPIGRIPPRMERDYLVSQYRQRVLDQPGASHEVNVTFTAETDREPDGTATDETRASDEWAFAFRSATIATKRVRYDRQEATTKAADTFDLTLILDAEQTKVVEESASRLASTSVREVPDGENQVDDDAPNDENTVTITTPDGETPIPDGDYVVQDWATEWLSTRGYRVRLTVGSP